MAQKPGPIDKMAELRKNYAESRKREAEEKTIPRKRRRTALIDSDDELEADPQVPHSVPRLLQTIMTLTIQANLPLAGESKGRQVPCDEDLRFCKKLVRIVQLVLKSAMAPTRRNTEERTSPTAETQKPKTRLTSNGATLYICPHPGCGRACRDLERLKMHSEVRG